MVVEEEPQPQVNVQEPEVNLTAEEYQNAFGANEQINLEEYDNNNNAEINYDEYQTTGTEQVQENVTGLQSTEVVKETEIRNSITEAVIRRSLNKTLVTENTLPVIRQEKINKVIYDTNVTTLPVIFGGNKVTYLSEAEAKNYDFGNLFQQANTQEVQGQDFNFTTTTTTQNAQETGFNTQDILGQGFTQTTQVQEYTKTTQLGQNQDYLNQISQTQTQTQDYTTQLEQTQTQNLNNQIGQVQDYSQLMPEQQEAGYLEYKRTSY